MSSAFDRALKPAAAVGSGICVAALGGTPVAAALAGAAVEGVGLFELVREVIRKSPIECEASLERLIGKAKERLLARRPDYALEYDDAANRLADWLPRVLPSPDQLGGFAKDPAGMVHAVTDFVVADLKKKGAGLDRDPRDVEFVRDVVSTIVEITRNDPACFPRIEPSYWESAFASFAALRRQNAELAAAQARLQAQMRLLDERVAYRPPLDLSQDDFEKARLFFFAARGGLPFLGREHERAQLSGWLHGSELLSWAMVVGPGGAGKSRLALELCLEARDSGWKAGFLTSGSALTDPARFAYFSAEDPTLIVIDYVAEAPERAGEIVRTLLDLELDSALKSNVRLLLLDREAQESAWWSRFADASDARLRKRLAMLGPRDTHLNVGGLEDEHLWSIFEHVTGGGLGISRKDAIAYIRMVDVKGRPLYAALMADAVKHGGIPGRLSRQALMHDVLLRERRRWRAFANSDEELAAHENAAALATMMGGLALPEGVSGLARAPFPFHAGGYNEGLMREITGSAHVHSEIIAIEPDIVGEWHVLDLLTSKGPFETRSETLMEAAETLADRSETAGEYFRAFRVRAAQDFAEEVRRTPLFRRPREGCSGAVYAQWAAALVEALEYLYGDKKAVVALINQMTALKERMHEFATFQIDAVDALARLIDAALKDNHLDAATVAASAVLQWSQERPDIPDLALPAATACLRVGLYNVGKDQLGPALRAFEAMRAHAAQFQEDEHVDRCELNNRSAYLGLAIRDAYARDGNREGVEAFDKNLWGRPAEAGVVDLAAAAAETLAEFRGRESSAATYAELKQRSLLRPDVPEAAYWAANEGWIIARHAETPRELLEAVFDLRDWVRARQTWPDMHDIIHEAIDEGWISEGFTLGPRAAEAAWAVVQDARASGGASQTNAVLALRAEIAAALEAHPGEDWTTPLTAEITKTA